MATKYGPRKKHNSGTVRTSTNNKGGSRTRKTVTVKTGNFTKSRSVNRNGTVRLTTTHKSPSGFITRSVSTVGSKPSKPKAPKFIKATPFKAPKMPKFKSPKLFKPSKMSSPFSFSSGRRSRSSSSGGDEIVATVGIGLFAGLFALIAWIFSLIFGEKEEEVPEALKEIRSLTTDQRRILIYDVTGKWVSVSDLEDLSEGYMTDTIQEFCEYDWENFDFKAWREENGYEIKN
jgi:hypothetical protein